MSRRDGRPVAQQFNRDPALIDNRSYIDNHATVHEYLQSHPTAQREIASIRLYGRRAPLQSETLIDSGAKKKGHS